ncbi:ESPR-type extended signal peptide-containing protein [Phocoenobacter skyensis]|nr:ESPR-type extended signal peptide-containing protein [Pasteurella skyensis]MDP8079866.1 ESPR-type extended signal peptide-containing protein [Pasteurella skyensis]
MNSIYKIVFNKATQTFTAVSELAKGATKTQSQSTKQAGTFLPKFAKIALLVTVTISGGLFSGNAYATPTVIAGNSTATGANSIAGGTQSIASGQDSIALGLENKATKRGSVAIGTYVESTGEFSVSMGQKTRAKGNNSVAFGFDTEAIGSGSLAMGNGSISQGYNSVAVGTETKASGASSVAMGYQTKTSGLGAFSIGVLSDSKGYGAVALGGSKSKGSLSTSLGYDSEAIGAGSLATGGILNADLDGKTIIGVPQKGGVAYTAGSMALGTGTVAGVENGKQEAFAMGYRAKATGDKSMALGFGAVANNVGSVALGRETTASGQHSIATGYQTTASGEYSIASGVSSRAEGIGSVAIGTEAVSKGNYSIALGKKSKTDGWSSMAIGFDNEAKGGTNLALGHRTKALQESAFTIGWGSTAENYHSYAFGKGSLAMGGNGSAGGSAEDNLGGQAYSRGSIAIGSGTVAGVNNGNQEAVAMGYRAKAVADKTLALGFDAKADHTNSVALGSNAETRDFTQVDGTEAINGLKYKEFSGIADGVVSVGKTAYEKQIINVAPGEISQTSTDAINGSQLYATTIVLGNVATSVKDNLGGNAAIDENGNITFTDIGGTGKDTVQEAIAFNKGNIETNTANIEGNRTAIATKADKDADNLSVADVNAWTTKLNNEADLAAPKGKLVTDTQVKDALDTKLETGDIKSSDKTVGITTAAGNVDLRVNLDNTSLTKNGNGVIGIKDGGVTTAKIADGNVTKAKLADDVTTILDKVGTGAIETANHNTVTGDVVKTYVDGKVATINTEVTNLGNTVNTLGDTITHVGKTSKETVKADNGSGINVKTTPATNEKGAIFTLSLDEDEVKALAGTTNLDTTYLKTDGSNVANKATFGDQVGTDTLGTSTKLAQIKAVKAVDDKVNTNTQDITDLEESVTTKLAKKANRNATNLNANDVAAWKAKIDTNSIETVTAGEGIDVSGGTAATNKEWVVALSQKTKTQLEKIDDNAAALAGKANISLDNISSDGTMVIKNAARDAVEVAVNPATEGVLKLVKTASTANHKDTYTLSIDETKLNDKVAETFAKKDASNLTDGDIADWKQALDIGNILTQANLADRLLLTGSNVGSDDNKVKFGKNVGKGEITGETTNLFKRKQ